MVFTIYFVCLLIISELSATKAEKSYIDFIEDDVLAFFAKEGPNTSCTEGHNLKLLVGGRLGKTDHSLVWKGVFEDKTQVAVKILIDDEYMEDEMRVFNALNATADKNIETHGIARIYYHGPIFKKKYYVIAMTLLDGTFEGLIPPGSVSEISILYILRQAVEVLAVLNQRHIIHNDIKPANLFMRGTKIFISDFDMATTDGFQHKGHTEKFASSGFFRNQDRYAVDDLESLIFSMWDIAGVPLVEDKPYGRTLSEFTEKQDAEAKVKEMCNYFKNEHVRKVFVDIFVTEILTKKPNPQYNLIIKHLNGAIDKAKGKTGMDDSWLKRRAMGSVRHEPILVKA